LCHFASLLAVDIESDLAQASKPMRILETPAPTLSKQNHFEFGFSHDGAPEGVPFSFRDSPDDKWFVRYGTCERRPLSFHDECLAAARTIRDSTALPIDVFFSGGIDSEVAMRSFLEAGIPIRVFCLKFANGLNSHDVEWAEKVCRKLGVSLKLVDLDILKFWENDGWDYATRTQCVSPQLLSTMWLADQTDGFCVLGSGENFIVKRVPNDYVSGESPYLRSVWDLFEKEKIAAWYRHFIVRGRDAAPGFFQYTPELMLSWFLDELGCNLWNDRIFGKRNSVSSKQNFYRRHFEIEERPKYTGFEHIQDEDAKFRRELRTRFDGCDHIVLSPVPTLVRQMLPPDLKSLERHYTSTFTNELWGERLALADPLPPVRMIDGRIFYT
jgi:hypothetical protein